MFIQLAQVNSGEPISVNVNHIRAIYPHDNGCMLLMAYSNTDSLYVRESYDTVRALIMFGTPRARCP